MALDTIFVPKMLSVIEPKILSSNSRNNALTNGVTIIAKVEHRTIFPAVVAIALSESKINPDISPNSLPFVGEIEPIDTCALLMATLPYAPTILDDVLIMATNIDVIVPKPQANILHTPFVKLDMPFQEIPRI